MPSYAGHPTRTYRPPEAPAVLGLYVDLTGYAHLPAAVADLRRMCERWEAQIPKTGATRTL